MKITIAGLEKVEGHTRIVAFVRHPEMGPIPSSKISTNRSSDENAAAYEAELEMMGSVLKEFEKEYAEYTHLHLGDAELMQEGETNG
jgi:hypothetical protein